MPTPRKGQKKLPDPQTCERHLIASLLHCRLEVLADLAQLRAGTSHNMHLCQLICQALRFKLVFVTKSDWLLAYEVCKGL